MPDKFQRRYVSVGEDETPSVEDVAQLITRLPYLDALRLAAAIGGDVDKIVEGAVAFLTIEESANG